MAGAEMAGSGSAVATRSGRMGSVGDPPSGSSVMNWPETVEPEGTMKRKAWCGKIIRYLEDFNRNENKMLFPNRLVELSDELLCKTRVWPRFSGGKMDLRIICHNCYMSFSYPCIKTAVCGGYLGRRVET